MATEPEDVGESPYADDVYSSGVEDAEFLDPAENLTGDDLDEPMNTSYSPPDFEPSAAKRGMTLTEQQEGPSLDDRLAAEVPDFGEGTVAEVDESRAGRLVAPDEGARDDVDQEPYGIDAGKAGSAASAEEAAMHFFDPDEREVDELEPVEVKEDGDRPANY